MHNYKPVYDMTKKNFQLKISFAVILKSFRVTKKDNKLPVNKKKFNLPPFTSFSLPRTV